MLRRYLARRKMRWAVRMVLRMREHPEEFASSLPLIIENWEAIRDFDRLDRLNPSK